MTDKERKHLCRGRKGCHGKLINKTVFLCLEVGSGTQMNQWWSVSTPRLAKGD